MTPPEPGCAELVGDIRDRLVNPLTGLRLHLEDLERAGEATPVDIASALSVVARIDDELQRALDELRCRFRVTHAG